MKTPFKLFLVIITSLVTNVLRGQDIYLPGEVAYSGGDTLKGYISSATLEQTPTSIWFRKKVDGPATFLKPADVKWFKMADSYYISSEVDLEASSKQLQSLGINPKLKFIRKNLFLQVLVQGPKSLYCYTDANNVDYFYIKVDGVITLLQFKRIYDDTYGTTNLREIKKYVGQLIYYFKDRPDLEKFINRTSYEQNSLVDLFNRYYDENASNRVSESNYSKVRFGLTANVSMNELVFSGESFPEFTTNVAKPKLSLMPGIFMEIKEPVKYITWSMYNEIQYVPYRFYSVFEDNLYKYTTRLDLDYLTLSSSLRYWHHFEKFTWFANAGVFYGIVVNDKNQQKMESLIVADRKEDKLALEGMNTSTLGVLLGTGLNYKRYSIEFRLGTGNGPSFYADLGSAIWNKSIQLSYCF